MAEPAEVRELPPGRRTCLYCGEKLRKKPSSVEGLCVKCAKRIVGPQRQPAASPASHSTPKPQPVLRAVHSRAALAELIADGPRSETPRMVGELLAADKRVTTFTGLLPFVGPWLIHKSDVHTAREKRWLSWLSIGITVALVGGVLMSVPTSEDLDVRLGERISSEMTVLAGIAEDFRSERGAYPDAATWQRLVGRADPRFYDPWGRPYRYVPGGAAVTIGTLGRDALKSGTGPDADVSTTFSASHPTR